VSGGFSNPIIGGGGDLVYPSIHSPNFVTGSSGWTIRKDGSAEFNSLVIRNGQVVGGFALYYSGTPAAGNLVGSIGITVAGTDSFNNATLPGTVNYFPNSGLAIQMWAAQITTFSGPVGGAGPWANFGAWLGSVWLSGGASITLGATPASQGAGVVSTSSLAPAALSALTTGTDNALAVETVIGTFTIPANDVLANSGYEFRIVGNMDATAGPTISFGMRLTAAGGTNIASGPNAILPRASTVMPWMMNGAIYFTAGGATGSLDCWADMKESFTAGANYPSRAFIGVPAAVNTGNAIVICLVATWSAAVAGNIVRTLTGSLVRINH
jgi:hypothetical protein